jgi:hypothetical protein
MFAGEGTRLAVGWVLATAVRPRRPDNNAETK